MNNSLERPSLLAFPCEIRQMILQELLSCDQVLRDIPTVAAHANDATTVWFINREKLQRDSRLQNTEDLEEYRSHIRYSLHPQILCVCRQVQKEGRPLLYNNAVGVTYLHGSPSSCHGRVHCLGTRSVDTALFRWPSLHEIRKWEMLIYYGPAFVDEPVRRPWHQLDKLYQTLTNANVRHLTITYKRAGSRLSYYTSSKTVDNSLLPFCLFPKAEISLSGELPGIIESQIVEFDLSKLKQPMVRFYYTLLDVLDTCIENFVSCGKCQGRTINRFTRDLEDRCTSIGENMKSLQVAQSYRESKAALELCHTKVNRVRSSCITCAGRGIRYDSDMLDSLQDKIRDLDELGPWKQKIL